jgi:hypothetical protein
MVMRLRRCCSSLLSFVFIWHMGCVFPVELFCTLYTHGLVFLSAYICMNNALGSEAFRLSSRYHVRHPFLTLWFCSGHLLTIVLQSFRSYAVRTYGGCIHHTSQSSKPQRWFMTGASCAHTLPFVHAHAVIKVLRASAFCRPARAIYWTGRLFAFERRVRNYENQPIGRG